MTDQPAFSVEKTCTWDGWAATLPKKLGICKQPCVILGENVVGVAVVLPPQRVSFSAYWNHARLFGYHTPIDIPGPGWQNNGFSAP